MEEKKQLKSIWGKWWEPLRKWFYPAWLVYEASMRFYGYGQSVHDYFGKEQDYIQSYMGGVNVQALSAFCSVATVVICSAFLTVPSCFILYKYFKTTNLTSTQFEVKMKFFL